MVLEQRLRADALALDAFASLNASYVSVSYRAPDLRRFTLDAKLDAPVVAGDGYRIVPEHRLLIEIPDNYLARDAKGMFVKSRIRRDGDRIFHPNVWPSDGYFCFDDKFVPSKSLAEQVWTALRLMQCELVNHDSPADWASDFYYLERGKEIFSQISPVQLKLPRSAPHSAIACLPRVA